MSAQILREAAIEARRLADGARQLHALADEMGANVAAETAGVVARHEAVADWLDHEAAHHDLDDTTRDRAIAVARAYLGEA